MSHGKEIRIIVIALTGLYPRQSSGPGIFLFGLLTDLSYRGTKGDVFTLPDVDNISAIGKYQVHDWKAHISFSRRAFSYISFVLKAISSLNKSDIVLFNSPPIDLFSFAILVLAHFRNKPSVWIVHGGVFTEDVPRGFIFNWLLDEATKLPTTLVAVSKAMAEIVYEQAGRRSIVIYNALSGIQPVVSKSFDENRDPIFLYLGRLAHIKRVDLIIRAYARVVEQHPKSKLFIVGDGPEKNELRNLAHSLGLEQVTFWGRLEGDAKIHILDMSDVLVLASEFESFGMVILEAWSRGMSVIGSRTGAIREIINDGESGLLFESGDWTNLFECMSRMCNLSVRKKNAVNGSNELMEKYTWETAGKKYYDLIEKLLAHDYPEEIP